MAAVEASGTTRAEAAAATAANPYRPYATAAGGVDVQAFLRDTVFGGSASAATAVNNLPALAPVMPWGAAIDFSTAGLRDVPLRLMARGEFNKVPVVLGTNVNEGSIFIPAFPLVVQGTSFPPSDGDLVKIVEHALDMFPPAAVSNQTEIIMANYPPYPLDDNWARGSDILTREWRCMMWAVTAQGLYCCWSPQC
jgi:hypothetical protein